MGSRFLMGMDAGGGGGRCILVEVETGRIVSAFRPWSFVPVPDTGGWGLELDLERMWSSLAEASREVLAQAGADAGQVLGIAATSLRHGVVVLDRAGVPLLAVPNRDARAASEGLELGGDRGGEFHQRTGHWPNPVFAGARLCWMSKNLREAWRQAATALSVNEWVAYRLSGAAAADPSQAAETILFDLETRRWADDLVESLDLPRRLLPPVQPSGTKLGTLTREAAAALGLRAGIPVAVGGADTQCGLLGMGAVEAGQLGAIAGTTTPVQLVTARPKLDPEGRLWTGCHVVPGLWVLESNAGAMGEALDWFARLLYPEDRNPVPRLMAEAAASAPGAAGVLSTLGAGVMNARNMGLPVCHLTATHMAVGGEPARKADLVRAVLEGMAYGLAANIRQIQSVVGGSIPELRLGGGMSRSQLWAQIVSEVLDRPVQVGATGEASALGAAICAGVGAGLFRDLPEAATALVQSHRRLVPDPGRSHTYRELFGGWENLRAVRAEADEVAANLVLQSMVGAATTEATRPQAGFRPRILVTADIDETGLARLRSLGEVKYDPYRQAMRLLSGPDLTEALAGYQVFVTEIDVVDADALQALPELRVIAACRGNAVNVDLAACTAAGVPVLHAPGRNAEAVADLTIAFMLMLSRRLPQAITFLSQPGGEAGDMARMGQAFKAFEGRELWQKTVGLVGLGAVGRGVARRLCAFGARVLVYDPYVVPEQILVSGGEPATLEVLLRESDIVSLHAAVTDETRGLVGLEALRQMKPGALLINTARAALVDEEALVDVLRSGHLGGAALDVFSVEPPGSDHPLLSLPNVIATPHIGGNTLDVAAHQGRTIADDLERLLRRERPRTVLNPEALADFSWETPRRTISAEEWARLQAGPAPAVRDLEQSRPAAAIAQPAPLPSAPTAGRAGGRLGKGLAKLRGRGEKRTEKEEAQMPSVPQAAAGNAAEQMPRLIRAFIARVTNDPALQAFASGHRLAMHFVLTDPAVEFHMMFRDGKVVGDLGAPAETPELRLKMRAEILDQMFTGRINPTKAAMTGKMSFSGDTRKAMGMQRIQGDLGRVYTQAREEVGGPGDLSAPSTAIGAAPPAAPARSAASVVPAAAASPAVVGDIRDELIQTVKELYATQLITATGGNLSVRIPGADEAWITPSALFKGDLRPEYMVRIGMDGQPLDPDAHSPSSERHMHCAVYRARPDVEAIIHAHAPYATILSLTGLPFLPISTEAAFLGDVGRVPFIMPGTVELATAVAEALGSGSAVLMQNHGILVAGSSLRRAADQAEVLERTSQVILGCYSVGKEPPLLPEDIRTSLQQVGEMMA